MTRDMTRKSGRNLSEWLRSRRPWPIVLLLAAISVPATGQKSPNGEPAIPPPDRLLSSLRAEHPRLLAEPGTFDGLRRRATEDEVLAKWIEHVRRDAERLLETEPSEYVIPDGKRLLATSRRVLGRTYTLAMMHRLDGEDDRYIQRLWRELQAAAAFKDWNPSHFLDTAEMTHAFAIGYDWLYHDWSEPQRATLRQAIITHGLEPAMKSYRGSESYGWWVRSHHNWNQVCNGGIAMGALAIAGHEPEMAGQIVHAGLESLRLAMREYAPDGGWPEGPGYWSYATRYNVAHLAALDSALGTDFSFHTYPGFSQTGDVPVHLLGSSGRSYNFADGSDGPIRAAQLFWLAEKFDRPDWVAHQLRLATPTAADVLWLPPPSERDGAETPLLQRHFTAIGVVTARSAWDDPDALFVGFKAGDNKVNHSHLDLGSFVFDALGHRWAIDIGGDDYNLPAYFGRLRWTYYRLRAEGHNTLVINPGEKADQDPKAAATIVRTGASDREVFAIADLTPAYAEHANRVVRGVALVNHRSQLLVQDEIELELPGDIWWFMHTRAQVTVNEVNPATAVLQIDDDTLHARIMEPAGARFAVMDAAPLPSSPQPEGQKKNEGIRKLAIHFPRAESLRLVVLLTPLDDDQLPPPPALRTKPLADW